MKKLKVIINMYFDLMVMFGTSYQHTPSIYRSYAIDGTPPVTKREMDGGWKARYYIAI